MRGDHIRAHTPCVRVWDTAPKQPLCWSSSQSTPGIPGAPAGIRANTRHFQSTPHKLCVCFFSFVIIFPKPYSQTQPFARARGGFVLVLTNGLIPLSSSRDTQNLNKKWALTIFWGPGSFSLDFQGEFLFHKALASCCHSKSCRSVACVMPAILAGMLHYTRASKWY